MADERYIRGLTMFLDVLQTQQTLYQSQRNLVDSKAQLSTDLVALYKALGGGWQTEPIVSDAVQLKQQPGLWFDRFDTHVKK
jgi:multidrug efflux system outer membrane protein